MFGDKISKVIKEKINKQITFREARCIMQKAFKDKPALWNLYVEEIAKLLHEERVCFMEAYEAYEANERKAKKVMEKIFIEER